MESGTSGSLARAPHQRGSQLARGLALLVGSLLLSLAIAELVARVAGWQPFQPEEVHLVVEPGGRYQGPDPVVGYRHLPGQFRITFPDGHRWTATHGPDTLRVTRPPDADRPLPGAAQIWLLGCSFVHGWGLDDAETLPWKLQAALPGYDVRNFGVGGYGTLQSLMQFETALAGGPAPALAILAYAGFHDERNTRLRSWRKATFAYQRFGTTAQPYARFDRSDELALAFDDSSYREMPLLRRSALLNLIDTAWSQGEDRRYRSHEVSQRLVAQLDALAREHGVRFVLAGITRGARVDSMLRFAQARGIPAVDIAVDGRDPRNLIAWDAHPSGRATDQYARTLVDYLRSAGLLANDAASDSTTQSGRGGGHDGAGPPGS